MNLRQINGLDRHGRSVQSGVDLGMFLHVTLVYERSSTVDAGKGSLAGMLPKMAHEIASTGQPLAAFRTVVDSQSVTYGPWIILQIRRRGEMVGRLATTC